MKKSWWILLGVLVLAGGGYLAYANLFHTTADAEFKLDAPKKSTGVTADLVGTWKVGAGSEAGYRILEAGPGLQRTVTGRTPDVTGTVTLGGDQLASTTVTVNLATVASDQPLRDKAFRESIMKTDQFPKAEFVQAKPVRIVTPKPAGSPLTVEVPGTLTLHGVSKPATAVIQAQAAGGSISVVGTIDVPLKDFGIDPPSLPNILTARDHGTVEFKLTLAKA